MLSQQSLVLRVSAWSYTVSGGMIHPGLKPHQCLLTDEEENDSATIMAAKRLAGVTPEVNFMEYVTLTPPPSTNKAAHSGFETQRRGDVTRDPKELYQ